MLKASWKKHTLEFKRPGGTSRGIMTQKETWFIRLWDTDNPDVCGIGECGLLKGLSVDDRPNYEDMLTQVCNDPNAQHDLSDWPSIRFGLEMAQRDLGTGGDKLFFESDFTLGEQGQLINGLIWMGELDFMRTQIAEKLDQGFGCLKLKIGALDFDQEIELLNSIRQQFPKDDLEIRVDANGAFDMSDALEKLNRLADLELHSIEQPIAAGQVEQMAQLCQTTPLPIALDEELIGISDPEQMATLLEVILPQYIILKPSLVGGYHSCGEWINLCANRDTRWWVTSALESNIGLNAIAQWTATLNNPMPQGLGTGSLFTNNFEGPLSVKGDRLTYDPNTAWDFKLFDE